MKILDSLNSEKMIPRMVFGALAITGISMGISTVWQNATVQKARTKYQNKIASLVANDHKIPNAVWSYKNIDTNSVKTLQGVVAFITQDGEVHLFGKDILQNGLPEIFGELNITGNFNGIIFTYDGKEYLLTDQHCIERAPFQDQCVEDEDSDLALAPLSAFNIHGELQTYGPDDIFDPQLIDNQPINFSLTSIDDLSQDGRFALRYPSVDLYDKVPGLKEHMDNRYDPRIPWESRLPREPQVFSAQGQLCRTPDSYNAIYAPSAWVTQALINKGSRGCSGTPVFANTPNGPKLFGLVNSGIVIPQGNDTAFPHPSTILSFSGPEELLELLERVQEKK